MDTKDQDVQTSLRSGLQTKCYINTDQKFGLRM